MDPDTTLAELIDAATQPRTTPESCARGAAEVEAIALDLAAWIGRGGFAPSAETALRILKGQRITRD